ncbi:MAG: hypothetical protein K5769_05115 [Pseudobutyrivibrio sp.]|nr:hypothetical protein [Pseudobutyrivibrio sp.]
MDFIKVLRGFIDRKMVVLLFAIILLFVVLFKSGMFGGTDERIRITCVGDSITYGSGVLRSREADSYPSQLQRKVGTSYLVSNFGLRNATASQQGDTPYIGSNEYVNSLKSNPDVVILMLGTNDSKVSNWNPNEYRAGLRKLVKAYQDLASKPKIYIMRSPHVYPINGDEAEYTIQIPVIDNQLGIIVDSVAEDFGAEVIDLYAATGDKADFYTDGVHFNKQGYEYLTDVIYNAIKDGI